MKLFFKFFILAGLLLGTLGSQQAERAFGESCTTQKKCAGIALGVLMSLCECFCWTAMKNQNYLPKSFCQQMRRKLRWQMLGTSVQVLKSTCMSMKKLSLAKCFWIWPRTRALLREPSWLLENSWPSRRTQRSGPILSSFECLSCIYSLLCFTFSIWWQPGSLSTWLQWFLLISWECVLSFNLFFNFVAGQGSTNVSGPERRCWQVLDTQCDLALQTNLGQSLCFQQCLIYSSWKWWMIRSSWSSVQWSENLFQSSIFSFRMCALWTISQMRLWPRWVATACT